MHLESKTSVYHFKDVRCSQLYRNRLNTSKSKCIPVTVTAFEWLRPSVLPKVSGQLVAPCKTPLAALPGTPVGFLT